MQENKNIKDILSREYLHRKEIHSLSELLSGEISAVEAYNLAIEKVKDVHLVAKLEECRNSHAVRVATLQDRMEILGEHCLESSGWWGAVARFVESGAAAIGDKVSLSVLFAGEDYGFSQYGLHMKDLDSETFAIAESTLLPEQGKTLQTITQLNASVRNEGGKNADDAEKDQKQNAA